MKSNGVKKKLRRGETSFGLWLTIGDLHIARCLARIGFDWLVVDLEHGTTDWSHAGRLIAAIADNGCVPLARVPSGTHDHIKRALDCGAWGIVVPMVDTQEQAERIVAAAKYPPAGNRSLGGALHALSFGTTGDEYFARANDEILVVVQIESPQGVQHVERISRVLGVDVAFVGPKDLEARMRNRDGSAASPDALEAAIQQTLDGTVVSEIASGILAMDVESASQRVAQGYQMVGVGTDLSFMLSKAQSVVAGLSRLSRD